MRIEGACLYIENEVERVLPVWPQGEVSWARQGKRLRFQGAEYADGSEIVVNGGEARLAKAEAPDLARFTVPPAPSCDTRLIWFVAPL